ncbi:MAG: hypothetical protein KGI60_04955 [Patescibacteria group bacterium]|nr:hypothetical protein [Patescibacteria group bacterium]
MHNRWYFELPSFPNVTQWEGLGPRDVYYDPKSEVAEECPLGTAPEGSLIAINVPFRHLQNRHIILDTFRGPDGKGMLMMVWRDERRPRVAGIAIAQADGTWRMRKPFECVVWEVRRDKDEKLIGKPIFQKTQIPDVKNAPLN